MKSSFNRVQECQYQVLQITPKLNQGQVCSNASANFFDKRELQGRAKLNQQQVCSNVSAHFLDKQALQGSFFASLAQLLYTGGLPVLFEN